jgi:hypothetical protein
VIRAVEARRRLGGVSKPSLWRLEQREPLLKAARCYVMVHKCYDEELFEVFLADYLARPYDPAGAAAKARAARGPAPSWTPDDIIAAEAEPGPARPKRQAARVRARK